MAMLIIQIAYYLILLFVLISGLFIVYHIVKFSYNKFATLLMLLVFCLVLSGLIVFNHTAFSYVNFEDLMSFLSL